MSSVVFVYCWRLNFCPFELHFSRSCMHSLYLPFQTTTWPSCYPYLWNGFEFWEANKLKNKKVLLRERKRHTARRVAIVISCYSGGGDPLTKKKFPSLNMYQAKSGVKKFSLYWGGGEHWSLDKNFFSGLNMYQAKSGVKNFSLYWGGGPFTKKNFLVWTCIKPNLVSTIFPFTGGGGSLDKKFFSSLNMYQAKSGV